MNLEAAGGIGRRPISVPVYSRECHHRRRPGSLNRAFLNIAVIVGHRFWCHSIDFIAERPSDALETGSPIGTTEIFRGLVSPALEAQKSEPTGFAGQYF